MSFYCWEFKENNICWGRNFYVVYILIDLVFLYIGERNIDMFVIDICIFRRVLDMFSKFLIYI